MPQPPAGIAGKTFKSGGSSYGQGGGHGGFLHINNYSAVDREPPQPTKAPEPEGYQPGSLRLPFTMMELVLSELSDRLCFEVALSETEASTIVNFAAELQILASKTASSEQKTTEELAVSDAFILTATNSGGKGAVPGLKIPALSEEEDAIPEGFQLESWQIELIDIFKELDADSNGSISAEELRKALVAAGVPKARLTKLIRMADSDRSGEISRPEWMRAITRHNHGATSELSDLSRKLSKTRQANAEGTLFQLKVKHTQWMIYPYSTSRMSWDIALSIVCFYIALVMPFTIAFENVMPESLVDGLHLVDRIIDYAFMFDVLLNFRTGYFTEDGELIMDWRKGAVYYAKTWFLLDFVSSFPFSDVTSGKMMDMQAFKLIKLFKLLKMIKLMSPRSVDVTELSVVFEDILQSKPVQMLYRRSWVFVNMIFTCHWMACGMKIVDEGFLTSYKDVAGHIWSEYLAALYFAMTTLTTVGFGDITPSTNGERGFTTVAMVIGGGFYGYVVGSITSMVANNDLNQSAYYERMDLIHAWLTHHRLPMNMKRDLRRYFKAYLAEKSAVSEADIWHDLSPELQRDVGEFIIHEDVKCNPLFDGMSIGSVVRLQSILQRVTVLTGRTLTTKGEVGTAMYIIVDGSLQMDTWNDKGALQTDLLGPGQSFGEEVLLGFCENYTYTVTVVEKAKLEMILEDEFLNLFQAMPNVLERMRQNAIDLNPDWEHMRRNCALAV